MGRDPVNAVCGGDGVIGVGNLRVRQSQALSIVKDRLGALLDRDGQDNDPSCLVLLVGRLHVRRLCLTSPTPAGAEGHPDWVTLVRAQRHLLAVHRRGRKVQGGTADRWRRTVAGSHGDGAHTRLRRRRTVDDVGAPHDDGRCHCQDEQGTQPALADSLAQAFRLAGRRSWTHGAVFLTLWVWQCRCRGRSAGYFA